MCCGIRCSNNWCASLRFSMATAPLEIMGYGRTIHTHHPALNPLGPITRGWWQATSQSTAVAARPLVCTLLPWWFSGFVKRNDAFFSQPDKEKNSIDSFKYCDEETPKNEWFYIFFIYSEVERGLCCLCSEADRELIGERLGRNQWLSADQCNEGSLNITPGLNPPISCKTM